MSPLCRSPRFAAPLAATLLATFLVPPVATAQQTLLELSSQRGFAGTSDNFGSQVAALGDVDGDGVVDLLVASEAEDDGSFPWASDRTGAVRVLSGATGAIVRTHVGSEPRGRFGRQIDGGGDLDGDGIGDYVVGTPFLPSPGVTEEGAAWAYSGATGALVHAWVGEQRFSAFGASVRIVGDLDGDGADDVAIGAPAYRASGPKFDAGRIYFHSGRTGALLRQVTGLRSSEELGTVRGLDDVDGDAIVDYLLGASGSGAGPQGEGTVTVCSGASGAALYTLVGEVAGDRFGLDACGLGDVDGDGRGDFAVAAPEHDLVQREGRLYVHSGRTGARLYQLDGEHQGEMLGMLPVSRGFDWNGDGEGDLAVGVVYAPSSSTLASRFDVRAGRDGRLLARFHGAKFSVLDEGLGVSSAAVGDLDGDGFADLLVGAPNASPNYAGEGLAYLFGGNDLCLQAAPLEARPGDVVVADLRGGTPGLLGLLLLIDVGGAPRLDPLLFAPFDAAGALQLSVGVPPGMSGLTFTLEGYGQARSGRGTPLRSSPVTVTLR